MLYLYSNERGTLTGNTDDGKHYIVRGTTKSINVLSDYLDRLEHGRIKDAPRATVPDEVMVSLNEIRADINYLFGRVAVDGSFMQTAIDSVRIKLDRVANWLSAAPSDGGK